MIIDNILKIYSETQSIRTTAKKVGCSWNRVVKILSSNSIIINDTHKLIMEMHDAGKSIEEIARQTGYNIKTIQSYLPAIRPYYNIDLSENAKRIRKSRNKTDY